jgi:hypothetical protein
MNMSLNRRQITDFIDSLDENGLSILREVWAGRRKNEQRNAFHQFMPGDAVWFMSRKGQRVTGRVIRRLRKNILIEAMTGTRWRVTPTLLNKSEN